MNGAGYLIAVTGPALQSRQIQLVLVDSEFAREVGIVVSSYLLEGGQRLQGEIRISGSKNAALPVLAATALLEGSYRIENVPLIDDIRTLLDILRSLGAKVEFLPEGTVLIDSSTINNCTAISEQVGKLRGSYYLLGALLGRFGEVQLRLPGGCNFGSRPIDLHLKGLRQLGAEIVEEECIVSCRCNRLTGGNIFLDIVSVGATVNMMLAATRAKGTTTIYNAAREPHIVDLANFLNAMGASIQGAGTDVIRIRGRAVLRPAGSYAIIPDQIEAGTYLAMAALTAGDITLRNVIPSHLDALIAKLREMGVSFEIGEEEVRALRAPDTILTATNFVTAPYPGFPTDLQPQMTVLLTQAAGIGKVTENVWNNRFQYIPDLKQLGARIVAQGRSAFVTGPVQLTGSGVAAHDLRAGASMVMAGLVSSGTTEISHIELIERGYENFVAKMLQLGATIIRREEPLTDVTEIDFVS
ncbi:MAG: UDP-N-acetylglucosamine 1-carboxyvinyltransferase [Saccharofermentanales bacterium]